MAGQPLPPSPGSSLTPAARMRNAVEQQSFQDSIPEHYLRDQEVKGHLPMNPGHQEFLQEFTGASPRQGGTPPSIEQLISLISQLLDRTGETAVLPQVEGAGLGGPDPLSPSQSGREVEALRRQVNPQGPVGRRAAGVSPRAGF